MLDKWVIDYFTEIQGFQDRINKSKKKCDELLNEIDSLYHFHLINQIQIDNVELQKLLDKIKETFIATIDDRL